MTQREPLDYEAIERRMHGPPFLQDVPDLSALVLQLLARCRELEKDREDLDWLWAHTHGVGEESADVTEWVASWSFPGEWPFDIREAIDAARNEGANDE